ncbi:MAG: SDR family NAD(P)-dependent oxidoreductase [Nocardioidaceae bacterium]
MGGGRARHRPADLRRSTPRLSTSGRIDLVLANAGISSYGTVRQIAAEDFERVVDVNLTGVYRTLHATIPYLQKSGGYALVVSSQAAFTPLAGLAAYNASKAGAEALALACRQEVAHLGIGVGVCHPSWVDTDIVRGAEADLPTFRALRKKLPWPANKTTTLQTCVSWWSQRSPNRSCTASPRSWRLTWSERLPRSDAPTRSNSCHEEELTKVASAASP